MRCAAMDPIEYQALKVILINIGKFIFRPDTVTFCYKLFYVYEVNLKRRGGLLQKRGIFQLKRTLCENFPGFWLQTKIEFSFAFVVVLVCKNKKYLSPTKALAECRLYGKKRPQPCGAKAPWRREESTGSTRMEARCRYQYRHRQPREVRNGRGRIHRCWTVRCTRLLCWRWSLHSLRQRFQMSSSRTVRSNC